MERAKVTWAVTLVTWSRGKTFGHFQKHAGSLLVLAAMLCGRAFSLNYCFTRLWDKLDSSVGWECFCLGQKWFSSWLGRC